MADEREDAGPEGREAAHAEETRAHGAAATLWRITRRSLKVAGGLVAFVVLAALVVAFVVLYSTSGLRRAAGLAIRTYSDGIPGSIEVGAIDGRLADHLILRDVVLRDSRDVAVVVVDRLALDWRWSAIVGRDLDVASLEVEGVRVDLRGDFGDLSSPGPPPPPSPTIGPNMPLALDAGRVTLRDVEVIGGDGLHLVDDLAVEIEDVKWSGLAAALSITSASGILPGAFLEDVALDVSWTEPVLRARGEIVADVGRIDLYGLSLDAEERNGEVALAVTGRRALVTERLAPAGLRPWLRRLTGDPRVELQAALDAQGQVAASLRAALPGLVDGVVVADGAAIEAPELAITSRFEIAAAALPEPALAPSGALRPVLKAQIIGESWSSLRAELGLRCVGCGELGGLDLWAEATRGADGEAAAELRLATAGVALEAAAEVTLKQPEETGDAGEPADPAAGGADAGGDTLEAAVEVSRKRSEETGGGDGPGTPAAEAEEGDAAAGQGGGVELRAARWELTVPALAATTAAIDPLVALPELAGRLTSAGRCDAAEGPLRCEGGLALDRFAGAGVRLGSLRADLAAEPLAEPRTAAVTLEARELVVDAAQLRLAGIDAEARLGPSTEREDALMIAAKLDAWAKRRGAGDHATLAAAVHLGAPLIVALERLELSYRGLAARLRAPTRATIGERRYAVDDLDLALAGGRIKADGAVDRDGVSDLELRIDDVQLERLAKAAPGLRGRIGGRLSADVELRGPAGSPVIKASIDGQALRLQGRRLGDLAVSGAVRDGRAQAEVALRGAPAQRVAAEASVPLTLDLRTGEVSALDGPLRAEARVERLDLKRLGPWLELADPALKARGTVDLTATLEGAAARPKIDVALRGRGLAVGDVAIGDVDLTAAHPRSGDATLELRLERHGGVVEVTAPKLPVRVDLSGGGLRWHARRPHELRAAVTRFAIHDQLAGIVDLPVRGVVDVEAAVTGPMTAPAADLRLRGHELRYLGGDLGELDLEAHVRDEQAVADLRLDGDLAAKISLHAEVPLRVAPQRRDVRWLPEGRHLVQLDVDALDLGEVDAITPLGGLRGHVDLDLQASAEGGTPTVDIGVRTKDLAIDGREIENGVVLDLDLAFRERLLKVDGSGRFGARGTLELAAVAPLRVDMVRRDVSWDRGADAQLGLRVTGIDRQLIGVAYALPPGVVTTLGFTISAKGNPQGYAGGLAVRGAIAHKDFGASPLRLDVGVNAREQTAKLDFGPLQGVGDLHADVATRADLNGIIAGRAALKDAPIEASVRTEGLGLQLFEPLLPEALFDVQGTLVADVEAAGKLAAPAVHGDLAVKDASITVVPLQQRFRGIQVVVAAAGKKIDVSDIQAKSGDGILIGDAGLELRDEGYKARADVGLRAFPFVRPGIPQMLITSQLRAKASGDAKGSEIGLEIAATEISVLGSTGKAAKEIPDSDAITYEDGRAREAVAKDISPPPDEVSAANERVAPEPEEEPKNSVIRVALVDPLEITGPKVAMRWSGAVKATTRGERREVQGQLDAKDGFLEFAGNRFKIESGSVTLPQDADAIAPFVDVVAVTEVQATRVSVIVRGRLPKPELILESSPPMEESAILKLLLIGDENASDGDEGQVLANAASLLAAFQNSALRNYVNQRTGIDQIALTFDEDVSQPVLSVGKRISEDLYVETAMRVNAKRGKNRVEARVEYEVAPHWTIESFFGDAAVGGVDLFWEKILGKPDNPALRSDGVTKKSRGSDGDPKPEGR
ncbi:MAG: translocation/assembly module TamB domain-containing protein [Nannocystaceae bacterium]